MAASGGFGAKVKLSVDKKGNSEFNKQIAEAVNKTKINLGEKLNIRKQDMDRLAKQIQTDLNAREFSIKNITVKNFKADAALKVVKKQLESMFDVTNAKSASAVSGGNKTSSTGGASGTAAVETQRAVSATKEWRNQMQALDELVKSVGQGLQNIKASKLTDTVDSGAVSNITQEYKEWRLAVEGVRSSHKALDDDTLRGLQRTGIELQDNIQNQQAASDVASRAAKQRSKEQDKEKANLRQIAQLYEQIQRYLNANSKIRNTGYGARLESMLTGLGATGLTASELTDIRKGFADVRKEVVAAGKSGKSFLDMLTNAYERFGGWSLVTRSLTEVVGGFRQVINNVIELDTAMTELKKVTDETDATYAKFFDDAISRSEKMGATLVDTVSATSDFARLGYDIVDSAELADAAIVYKNVGDGIEDIGTASESLISTMAAFGVEAENAMHIVDSFNEVDNKFAISSAGIGEALIRSASGLAAAGNTMEESIALITAMNTTVQNPDKVGKRIAQCRSNAA